MVNGRFPSIEAMTIAIEALHTTTVKQFIGLCHKPKGDKIASAAVHKQFELKLGCDYIIYILAEILVLFAPNFHKKYSLLRQADGEADSNWWRLGYIVVEE